MIKVTFLAGLFGTCAAVLTSQQNSGARFQAAEPPVRARHAVAMAALPISTTTRAASGHRTVPSPLGISDQLHGIARPGQLADLPSLIAGTIAQVHVQEGDTVSKGMPLVTLDDRVPRARLEAATVEANLTGALRRAEVELRMARQRLERLQSALNQGAGARFEIEEAEGVRDQADAAVSQQRDILKASEANRKLAEAQLVQYTLVAPFDGVVTEIHIKSGPVDPSQILLTVANLDTLQVEMHLPARIYGTVKAGQRVTLVAGIPVARRIKGSVVSSSPIINSASNTFRALIDIENKLTPLPAGFSVLIAPHQE